MSFRPTKIRIRQQRRFGYVVTAFLLLIGVPHYLMGLAFSWEIARSHAAFARGGSFPPEAPMWFPPIFVVTGTGLLVAALFYLRIRRSLLVFAALGLPALGGLVLVGGRWL